jgi:Glycosyltransferase
MKRVLCLIDSLGPGGAQRQIVGLALFLKERGYEVIVAAYYNNQFYVDQLSSGGVSFNYIQRANKGLLRQWYLMKYINSINPDVVIAYLESPSMRACVSHLFNRRYKLIVSERNTTQHIGLRERIRFTLFHLADYIVPNSYSQEAFIKQFFPRLTNKVVTISNFVDLQSFVPIYHPTRREVPEIVVVATIWGSKNTLGFIDAVAQLKKEGKRFHVSWYGKDESRKDYFDQCQNKINELEVNDYIDLKDKTPDIIERYQEADFFCLPSFYEGTPNVICEAMACGLPIACSSVCDNGLYVVDEENGYLFDPRDSESIASAITRLLALNEADYKRFCEKSRERAERMLSKDVFVQSYIDLIEK